MEQEVAGLPDFRYIPGSVFARWMHNAEEDENGKWLVYLTDAYYYDPDLHYAMREGLQNVWQ